MNAKSTPILAFSAYSGTGKTTLIEKLINALKEKGVRVAAIKHDGHDFEVDYPGKDSWRYIKAGADTAVISSNSKTALIMQEGVSLGRAAAMMCGVDLILVEGYKQENVTQIGLCRQAVGKGFVSHITRYVAVVTDCVVEEAGVPCFGFDDVQILSRFILNNMSSFTHINSEGIIG